MLCLSNGLRWLNPNRCMQLYRKAKKIPNTFSQAVCFYTVGLPVQVEIWLHSYNAVSVDFNRAQDMLIFFNCFSIKQESKHSQVVMSLVGSIMLKQYTKNENETPNSNMIVLQLYRVSTKNTSYFSGLYITILILCGQLKICVD